MENKFAVLIPKTTQIGIDTWRDSFTTLVLSKKLTFDEIMIEVRKVSKDEKLENIHFTEIVETKESPACIHEWDEGHRGVHKCKLCGKFSA